MFDAISSFPAQDNVLLSLLLLLSHCIWLSNRPSPTELEAWEVHIIVHRRQETSFPWKLQTAR